LYRRQNKATNQSIKLFRKINDKEGESKSLYRLGKISFHLSECTPGDGKIDFYNEALVNYKSAFKIAQELNDTFNITDNQIEIGRVLFSLNKPDSALDILTKVLVVCEKRISNPDFLHNVAKTSFNIALIYIQQDSLQKAIDFLFKAAAADSMLNNKEGLALIRVAEIYLKLGKIDKAYSIANQSLDTAVKFGYNLRIFQAKEVLYKIFEKKGNYKNAYEYLLSYKLMNDSLKDDKYVKELTKIKIENEYEIKHAQEEVENQAKLGKQKLITYSVALVLLLLVAFLVYGIYTFRQKQKANTLLALQNQEISQQKEEIEAQRDMLTMSNEEILQQKEEIETQRDEIEAQRDLVTDQRDKIEHIHLEITQSIAYATKIQTSILPEKNLLDKYFTESFILFKPKDNVSGDYYWWAEVENQMIIAVADCTGHGVPGAFMSMLGTSFLRETVLKEYMTNPAIILKRLRKEVIKTLKQKGESGEQKDGMDMSILTINYQAQSSKTQAPSEEESEQFSVISNQSADNVRNQSIQTNQNKISGSDIFHAQWAGANNPLWIIRTVTQSSGLLSYEPEVSDTDLTTFEKLSNLEEIKPDKMPIAIYLKMDNFTNHELQLQKGDCLYMMSDGYEDQFGGENNKKFKSKQLKQLIVDNCQLSMEQQHEILNITFENWRGESEQVDDVTILGLRI